MSQRTIIFSSPEDVLNFVRTVEKYPYDMDLESGRAVVDAKSLLGLMTQLSRQLILSLTRLLSG